jgi:phage-related protein
LEITDARLSVMAQTGVEHVIAIDLEKTHVTRDGQSVSIKELREGDIITVELDEVNPVKFARNISMRGDMNAVARNRR